MPPARVDWVPEKEYYELRGKKTVCRADRSGQPVSVKRTGWPREYLSAPMRPFMRSGSGMSSARPPVQAERPGPTARRSGA